MFTMCDLLNTRLQTRYVDDHIERGTYKDTFFYRDLFRKKALIILEQAKSVIDPYVSNLSARKAPLYSCFKEIQKVLKVELEKRNDGK